MRVILFDGVCNLCNWIVRFIIKADKRNRFKFASLQSSYGESLTRSFNLSTPPFETIILYEKERVYFKSDAVIKIMTSLPGGWKFFRIFKIIPKQIRDYLYDIIARNRYRVFGKRDNCMIPTEEQKEKFIDKQPFSA